MCTTRFNIWAITVYTLHKHFDLPSNKCTFLVYADDTTLLGTYNTLNTNTDTD